MDRHYFDRVRVNAISFERRSTSKEGVNGLSGRDARKGANFTRVEILYLSLQLL